MNDDIKQGKQLAWAVLSKAKGSQLSQVIKVTNHIEADETVAAQPDTPLQVRTILYRLKF